MSPIRLHKWVLEVLTRHYPGRYYRRRLPVIRPKRRSITMDIDQLGERASPTALAPVDPATAYLVNFTAIHEPLAPAASVPIAEGQAASLSADPTCDVSPVPAYF